MWKFALNKLKHVGVARMPARWIFRTCFFLSFSLFVNKYCDIVTLRHVCTNHAANKLVWVLDIDIKEKGINFFMHFSGLRVPPPPPLCFDQLKYYHWISPRCSRVGSFILSVSHFFFLSPLYDLWMCRCVYFWLCSQCIIATFHFIRL